MEMIKEKVNMSLTFLRVSVHTQVDPVMSDLLQNAAWQWHRSSCRVPLDNGRKCKGEKGRGRVPLPLWLPVPADFKTLFLKAVPFSHNLKKGTKPLAQGPLEDIKDLWTYWAVILTSIVWKVGVHRLKRNSQLWSFHWGFGIVCTLKELII